MQKIIFFGFLFLCTSGLAQIKTVFNNNLSFGIPAGWYMKDSSATRILLRKTGDEYAKIEIKITAHKEKDLVKYSTLDKKKFMPDPHVRTVLPDANLGGKLYKKIKYFTKNPVLKVDTDLEYIRLFNPRIPIAKFILARLEVIATCSQSQEPAYIGLCNALVAGMKY
jgi:hypothetical protein